MIFGTSTMDDQANFHPLHVSKEAALRSFFSCHRPSFNQDGLPLLEENKDSADWV
jgi:hypothetical protein